MAPTLYKKHFVLALAALAGVGLAANEPMLQELSPFEATAPRVANPQPAGTFPMPVSALTFEPLVDVQARNLAEAQGDVSIRGGIFENTGFSLGAATLLDPQTGHYFAEIPAAPAMLTEPEIYTGVANALWG
ncbi:MAG: TonB-dependent receptor, partial [Verrucomicrobiota bacterium]